MSVQTDELRALAVTGYEELVDVLQNCNWKDNQILLAVMQKYVYRASLLVMNNFLEDTKQK